MKKIYLFLFLISASLVLQAQTADKPWGFGLGAGAYGNFDKEGVGVMPQLYFSRFLSPTFDVMLQQNIAVFNSKVRNDLDAANTVLNLRLKLYNDKIINSDSPVKPYVYGGPGLLFDNNTEGLNFNLGIGSKFAVAPSTAIFLEGGYIDGVSYEASNGGDRKEDMWKVVGGIEFSFGKAKDSDEDGVPDRKDNCPDTPYGVTVDENGCPIDTDGDGIPDYKDDCPREAGLTSLAGCPDRDGDGIADKYDECPDDPGLEEFKGCPDTDGDGVPDKDDECPDTPKGYKVDDKGCPIDTDGDGLVDEEDECPTEAGPIENKGCPVKEEEKEAVVLPDIKVKPVYFVVDKSYLTEYTKGKLDKLVTLLEENPEYNVNLFGHTDSQASEEYNMDLAAARVKSVTKYLVEKGLDKSRITNTEALGESQPVASNDTEEGRKLNRRVEFEIFLLK